MSDTIYFNHYEILLYILSTVMKEKPESILEISASKFIFANLFNDCQERLNIEKHIDRFIVNDVKFKYPCELYNEIYLNFTIEECSTLPIYDFIFIADVLERWKMEMIEPILNILQTKVNKQILIVTPEYPFDLQNTSMISKIREYHPVAFCNFDFSYKLYNTTEVNWQFYSIFKKNNYANVDIDYSKESIYNLNPSEDKNGLEDCNDENNTNCRFKKLKIAYVLPNAGLTGGIKALLHQAKFLAQRGHEIHIYRRGDGTSAIPSWSEVTENDVSKQVLIPIDKLFKDYITQVDVIILGWMEFIPQFNTFSIPIVLWEQGSEYTYGDYKNLLTSDDALLNWLKYYYRSPVTILSVSWITQKILKCKYNRNSQLCTAGIDTDFYFPINKEKCGHTILLVGNPFVEFKGFPLALKALEKAHNDGANFKVKWACQGKADIQGISFDIDFCVMPKQEELATYYRESDIFLSTSLYESFALTPLEAMASGTTVISTDNGGIRTYAENGVNCILVEQGNIDGIAEAIKYLLNNPEASAKLASEGIKTALKYSFPNVISRLEQCLYNIVIADNH